jgi:hypothetical protein
MMVFVVFVGGRAYSQDIYIYLYICIDMSMSYIYINVLYIDMSMSYIYICLVSQPWLQQRLQNIYNAIHI